MRIRYLVTGMAITLICVGTLKGDITSIGQFTGDRSDDFSALEGGAMHPQSVDIFEGVATAMNIHPEGFLGVQSQSNRGRTNTDTVRARTAPIMLGQLGIIQWDFNRELSQIGMYFENNSLDDDVVVTFYDRHDNLIGTETATTGFEDQSWTWNGWHSDTPFTRIVTTGNDESLFNGFIWFDDVEITFAPVPEPTAALGLTAMGLLGIGRRRRIRN